MMKIRLTNKQIWVIVIAFVFTGMAMPSYQSDEIEVPIEIYDVSDTTFFHILDKIIETEQNKEYYFSGGKIFIRLDSRHDGKFILHLVFQGFNPTAKGVDGCFIYRGHECLLYIQSEQYNDFGLFKRTDQYVNLKFSDPENAFWLNDDRMAEWTYVYDGTKFRLSYYYDPGI